MDLSGSITSQQLKQRRRAPLEAGFPRAGVRRVLSGRVRCPAGHYRAHGLLKICENFCGSAAGAGRQAAPAASSVGLHETAFGYFSCALQLVAPASGRSGSHCPARWLALRIHRR